MSWPNNLFKNLSWKYPDLRDVPEEKRILLALYLDEDMRWTQRLRKAFAVRDMGQRIAILKKIGIRPPTNS